MIYFTFILQSLVEINNVSERLITPCSHGGTPNYDEKNCECPPFFTGTLCEYSKQSVRFFPSLFMHLHKVVLNFNFI